MVKYQVEHTSRVFAALADPTRRGILAELLVGERSVGQLVERFDISAPAISKHLRVLEKVELVTQTKVGRIRQCKLNAAPLEAASRFLEEYRVFWECQLDSLENYLEQDKKGPQ